MKHKPKNYGTCATIPSGVKSSDGTGERSAPIRNGIAMGKKDGTGGSKKYGK